MTAPARGLVLGAWASLPPRQLEPFVRSLRATGFDGSFCLLLGRHDPAHRQAFEDLSDVVIDAGAFYPPPPRVTAALLRRFRTTRGLRRFYDSAFRLGVGPGRFSSARWHALEYDLEGLQSLRYHHYYRAILMLDPRPEVVMVTDLRDVVFQRDPFADPVGELELYLEDVRIGDDYFNTRWLRQLYGGRALEGLLGQMVSCSGTVLGTSNGVLAYLTEMTVELSRFRRAMGAHDQAAHNRLLHDGLLPAARVIPNGTGRVLTLGARSAFRFDEHGMLLNDDGTVPAVLHQWDRHPSLAAQLEDTGLIRWDD